VRTSFLDKLLFTRKLDDELHGENLSKNKNTHLDAFFLQFKHGVKVILTNPTIIDIERLEHLN
jgi:hypothetical protein